MNIYSLSHQVKVLQEIGYTIDTSQRLRLQLSLLKLSQLANADQLLFWGKISTISTPYYVAVAIDFKNHYGFPHKKFYYSKDDFVFVELPSLDPYNKPNVDNHNNTPFTGVPSTVLINNESEEKKQPIPQDSDQEEEDKKKVVVRNYTEEDRLAYTVNAIEIECQVVPIGAFKMTVQHQLSWCVNKVQRRVYCEGNQREELSSFQIPTEQGSERSHWYVLYKTDSAESVFRSDFLDSIQNNKMWSFQSNTNQTIMTARSLQWVGYIAFVVLNKKQFGGVYFGNGIKNLEISFCL